MSLATQLALGIAAIDCLLSAFIAMLLLCFSLVAEDGSAPEGVKHISSLILVAKIPAGNQEGRVRLEPVVLDKHGRRISNLLGTKFDHEYRFRKVDIPPGSLADSGLGREGFIQWRDCEMILQPGQGFCSSQLWIFDPDVKSCILLSFLASTTTDNFADGFPDGIRVKAYFAGTTFIEKTVMVTGALPQRQIDLVIKHGADGQPSVAAASGQTCQ
jgi:hypothetical protein